MRAEGPLLFTRAHCSFDKYWQLLPWSGRGHPLPSQRNEAEAVPRATISLASKEPRDFLPGLKSSTSWTYLSVYSAHSLHFAKPLPRTARSSLEIKAKCKQTSSCTKAHSALEGIMFRFMRDGEPEDPMFVMDPLAIHHQHVNRVLSGGFGYTPFLSIGNGTVPGTRQASRRMQAGTVSPFGMLGMAGGFMDMFGMMNDMIGNMEHMTSSTNCQTFTSSTVISYSNLGDAPKVYQETSETRSAPGGIRETRRTVRDSDSGLEQMSIGHHIRERAHIMQRSRNHRTGDQEERQDYINLDESDAAAFDDEWRRETSRFRTQRGLDYRRHEGSNGRRAEGTRLAIQGPEESPTRQSRRYDW